MISISAFRLWMDRRLRWYARQLFLKIPGAVTKNICGSFESKRSSNPSTTVRSCTGIATDVSSTSFLPLCRMHLFKGTCSQLKSVSSYLHSLNTDVEYIAMPPKQLST
mmetsp:Transcript_3386/g.4897  ORF Transcript_3386/g.4897 Transcript_3386/m.4897 type:complete len:108 (-) Transcript_3386:1014-1337(-)